MTSQIIPALHVVASIPSIPPRVAVALYDGNVSVTATFRPPQQRTHLHPRGVARDRARRHRRDRRAALTAVPLGRAEMVHFGRRIVG